MWVLGFTLSIPAATGIIASDKDSSSPTAAKFLAHQAIELSQYRAFRKMHARSERFKQEGWLEVWTELDRRGFRYEIVSERGSDYIRNKVLKAILKKEQELIAEGDAHRGRLTTENYEFSEVPSSEDGLRYVGLKPKRKDVLLVHGRMVLSPDGTELLRVEGRLSKNPSFWTSLVNIIRRYAKVNGVRVPVSTVSVAKVKLAGQSQIEVHYEYESINGRPVTLSARNYR